MTKSIEVLPIVDNKGYTISLFISTESTDLKNISLIVTDLTRALDQTEKFLNGLKAIDDLSERISNDR